MEFHSYRYRAPRYAAHFPVLLETNSSQPKLIQGHCTDVSEGGLAAKLNERVPLGSTVVLSFTVSDSDSWIRVTARVTHRCGGQHGFAFLYASETETREVRHKISSSIQARLAARPMLQGTICKVLEES